MKRIKHVNLKVPEGCIGFINNEFLAGTLREQADSINYRNSSMVSKVYIEGESLSLTQHLNYNKYIYYVTHNNLVYSFSKNKEAAKHFYLKTSEKMSEQNIKLTNNSFYLSKDKQ